MVALAILALTASVIAGGRGLSLSSSTCSEFPRDYCQCSEHFESILLTILPRISILLLRNHHIVPRISLHTLPYRKTTKKYEKIQSMVFFSCSCGNSGLKTWFCNCPQYLCLFHTVFEYTPGIHSQRKMLVHPN